MQRRLVFRARSRPLELVTATEDSPGSRQPPSLKTLAAGFIGATGGAIVGGFFGWALGLLGGGAAGLMVGAKLSRDREAREKALEPSVDPHH